jgi:hypothetical protein
MDRGKSEAKLKLGRLPPLACRKCGLTIKRDKHFLTEYQMPKIMKQIILNAYIFAAAVIGVHAQQTGTANPNPVDPAVIAKLTGTWTNQMESTLTISNIDPASGQITGNYVSSTGASPTAFPLLGWVNTSAPNTNHVDHAVVVSFSVRWGTFGSVTAWNGTYTTHDKQPEIVGQWLLSRPNTDFAWDHVLVGQDQFHRTN